MTKYYTLSADGRTAFARLSMTGPSGKALSATFAQQRPGQGPQTTLHGNNNTLHRKLEA